MKRLLVTITLLAAACAPAPKPVAAVADPCEVKVVFGSECCGIDTALQQRVSAYSAAEPLVAGRSEMSWGREGERTLCLAVASADAGQVFDRIRLLMNDPSQKGWTELTQGERSYRSEPAKP